MSISKDNSSEISKGLINFIQNSPQAIAMYDTNMNYIACSSQWLQDWWISHEPMNIKNIIGKNHYELFDDVPEYWKNVHKRALNGATEFNENDQFIRSDGKKEWLRWHIRPWKDEADRIGGIILFTELITERKEAEELVIESQAKLSKLVENLPGMAYSCDNDDDWTIRFVSSGTLEITGYSVQEFVDEKTTSFAKITYAEDKEYVWQSIKKCLNRKKIFEVSYRIFTKSKETKYLFERGQGVFDINGNLLSIEGIILDITSQKLMEDALKRSRANLIQAQKVAKLGSWEWNIETNDVYWSEEFYHICGYSPGEIEPTFQKGLDFIHPADQEKAKKAINESLKGKIHNQIELRFIQNKGNLRYILAQSELISHKKLIGTIQDITDRKVAEIALKESEERNKALLTTLPDMIFIHQIDGTFLDFEIPSHTSLDFSRKKIIGKDLDAFYPKSISKQMKAKFLLAYKNNELQNFAYNTTIQGKKRYYEARIVKYKLGQVLVVLRDITKNKEDELIAAESQKSFYKAFHISPVPVTISKIEDSLLLEVNDRFCELVNMERGDIIGKTALELNFWEDHETRKEFANLLRNEGKVYDREYQIRIANGALKPVLLSAEVIEIESKACILLMISDISESKKAQNELIQLTKELTSSNHELRQFAYITSHNLRAPVVNIDTLLSFVNKEDIGDPENKEIIDRMEQSVHQLNLSLNDLIQLVAIKDKKYEADEKIYFSEVYDAVHRSIQTQIKSSGAIIETDFNVPYIMFKKPLLESILLNLLSNAIKYRNENIPIIKIKTVENGDLVCMSMSDNGLGIDLTKNKDKIFSMYQRFHENKEGKGLGLYIIKSQIESMGGKIEVESQLNQGSTFKVFFKNKRD